MTRNKVYDADTVEAATGDAADQNTNGDSGWETTAPPSDTPIGFAKHTGRHTYRDGVCVKCGKREGEPSTPSSSDSPRRELTKGRSSGSGMSREMLLALLWLGAGIGLENIPEEVNIPILGPVVERISKPQAEGMASPTKASGRVMQLEAAIAGKRLDKAVRGTLIGKALDWVLSQGGPLTELLPLLLPPIIIGVAASAPALMERFPMIKTMMVGALMPVLAEAAKLQDQQAALVGSLDGVNQEAIAKAVMAIQGFLQAEPKDNGV
jgi:hypothetical protein